MALGERQRLLGGAGDQRLEAHFPREIAQNAGEALIVLDDQQHALGVASSASRSSSTLRAGASGVGAAATGCFAGRTGSAAARQRLLARRHPRRVVDLGDDDRERAALAFGRLCSRIVPPSSRASSREIESPRPVPPYLRLIVPSAWRNASKTRLLLFLRDADAGIGHREGDPPVAGAP